MSNATRRMILFDGLCVFCSGSMRFVMRHSPTNRWRYVALQSEQGRALAGDIGIDPDDPTSLAVIAGDTIQGQSDAVFTIAASLNRPWSWLRCFRVIPRPLRDLLYRWIARNRYRFAGRRQCIWQPEA